MYIILFIFVLLIFLFLKPGYTSKIISPNKEVKCISELIKIEIGSSQQFILIRSENINNPILLFVHGGPGTSQLTQIKNNTKSIEKHFTVVNWDQRGAGKSYYAVKDKSKMNINQFVLDLIELTEYLTKRFDKQKIIIVGHSWGTVISSFAIQKRPELYSAYIGVGQVSNMLEGEKISYNWTLEQTKLNDDLKSYNLLKSFGEPPYSGNWKKKFMTQRQILGKYGGEFYNSKSGAFLVVIKNLLISSEYTVKDWINFFRGIFESVELLMPELLKVNLFESVKEVEIPVYIMLGRHDFEVPSILSQKYFEVIKAPSKELIWFENSSHLPNTEERDLFNKYLVEHILPNIKN